MCRNDVPHTTYPVVVIQVDLQTTLTSERGWRLDVLIVRALGMWGLKSTCHFNPLKTGTPPVLSNLFTPENLLLCAFEELLCRIHKVSNEIGLGTLTTTLFTPEEDKRLFVRTLDLESSPYSKGRPDERLTL